VASLAACRGVPVDSGGEGTRPPGRLRQTAPQGRRKSQKKIFEKIANPPREPPSNSAPRRAPQGDDPMTNGRDTKPFIRLPNEIFDCAAFLALSPSATKILRGIIRLYDGSRAPAPGVKV